MKRFRITFLICLLPFSIFCIESWVSLTHIRENYGANHFNSPSSMLPYLHDGVDLHYNGSLTITALNSGRLRIFENSIHPNDYVIRVGNVEYGHIEKDSWPSHYRNGMFISQGDTIGKLRIGNDWNPHVHLRILDSSQMHTINPMVFLAGLGYDCSQLTEHIDRTEDGKLKAPMIAIAPSSNVSDAYISKSVDIFALFNLSSHSQMTAPKSISWSIDNTLMGTFTYNANLPKAERDIVNNSLRDSLYTRRVVWKLSDNNGVEGTTRGFNSDKEGYFNTLQGKTGDWQVEVDPCDEENRKFDDGEHQIVLDVETYCNGTVSDTLDIIIDNTPPRFLEGDIEKVENEINLPLSEKVNEAGIEDCINITVPDTTACPNSGTISLNSEEFDVALDAENDSILTISL
ncbi:MAG: hypothetical protein ACLFSQ_12435, partial [Candidatus Zixiibacteriota bacterium]